MCFLTCIYIYSVKNVPALFFVLNEELRRAKKCVKKIFFFPYLLTGCLIFPSFFDLRVMGKREQKNIRRSAITEKFWDAEKTNVFCPFRPEIWADSEGLFAEMMS